MFPGSGWILPHLRKGFCVDCSTINCGANSEPFRVDSGLSKCIHHFCEVWHRKNHICGHQCVRATRIIYHLVVTADASDVAIGAVLSQKAWSGGMIGLGELMDHPCGHLSKLLSVTQQNLAHLTASCWRSCLLYRNGDNCWWLAYSRSSQTICR